jgi:hypothetical protein
MVHVMVGHHPVVLALEEEQITPPSGDAPVKVNHVVQPPSYATLVETL